MRTLIASLLPASAAASCSAAHADQPFGPPPRRARIALGIAPAKIRAPYDVQVIRENGNTLPTYGHRDRFYVQGNAGERYIIRVTNPTARRVEAVVTVDGLDVIDGEDGDLRKRGYVVPPYGEVRVEGFRTSQSDVATFRFNSVNDSYANKKGKARNVGVIAVAIFEEIGPQPEQQIIVGDATHGGGGGYRRPYDYNDDLAERSKPAKSRKGSDDERPNVVSKAPRPAPDADGKRCDARRRTSGRQRALTRSRSDHHARPARLAVASATSLAPSHRIGRRHRRWRRYVRRRPVSATTARVSVPSSASRATRPRASPSSFAPRIARSPSPSSATTTPPASPRSASTRSRSPTPAS
jgi:hypothetical protein